MLPFTKPWIKNLGDFLKPYPKFQILCFIGGGDGGWGGWLFGAKAWSNILCFPLGIKLGTSFSLLGYVSQIYSSLCPRIEGTSSLSHPSVSQIFVEGLLCTKHCDGSWDCAEHRIPKRLFNSSNRQKSMRFIKYLLSICRWSGSGVIGNLDTPKRTIQCSCRSD